MSAVLARSVVPVVTAVAAALYLAVGVPRDAEPERVVALAFAQDQAPGCATDGRAGDDCSQDVGGQPLAAPANRLAGIDGVLRRASR